MKVAQEDPMYTHLWECANGKRASVLDLISQAIYIRFKNFIKCTPHNMERGNQMSNAFGTGPKAQSIGPKARQTPWRD